MYGRAQDRVANPIACLVAGAGAFVAGPLDLALLRFGWADLDSGQVSNVYDTGLQLGFVLPVYRMWSWNHVYSSCDAPMLRAGMGVVLATQGDFATRFAEGAQPGARVYANPLDGTAAATPDAGYIETQFTCMGCAACGEWAYISSWPNFNH